METDRQTDRQKDSRPDRQTGRRAGAGVHVDFGLRVSGFRAEHLRVQELFGCSGLRIEASGCGFRVVGFGLRTFGYAS